MEHEESTKSLDPGKDRRWQYAIRILTGAMFALLGIFVGIIIYFIARPTPFDPLSFQTVLIREVAEDGTIIIPQVPDKEAPSVYVNQGLPTFIQFCAETDEAFDATGNTWFVNNETGARYDVNTDIILRIRPGCISARVTFDIPEQIRVDLLDLPSGNPPSGESSQWHLEGEVTPKQDGGVTAPWKSEAFYIIAERAP
jgi:hypothetical protein